MQGWISLHRKIFNNPVMFNTKYLAVWVYLLTNANHKDNYFIWNNKKTLIKRGEQITSIKGIANSFKLDRRTLKRIFEYLQNDKMITFETTSKFTKVNIINYDKYQDNNIPTVSPRSSDGFKTPIKKSSETLVNTGVNEGGKNKTPIKCTSNAHQTPTNNNVNNDNNKRYVQNEFEQTTIFQLDNTPSKDELLEIEFNKFWIYYNKKTNKVKCLKKWKQLSTASKNLIREHLPKYIRSTPDKKFRKNPLTYLNNESWNDEIISFNNAVDNQSSNKSLTNRIGVQ